MRIVNVLLPKKHTHILSGDYHIGSAYTSHGMIDSVINRIEEDDHTYLSLMGDQVEAIAVDDKRFSLDTHILQSRRQTATVIQQYGYVEKLLEPVADNVNVVLIGNHEQKVEKNIGPMTEEMCKMLGIQYGGYTCKLNVFRRVGKSNKELSYSLLLWHGYGSINSRVDDPRQRRRNKLRSVRRKLSVLEDDVHGAFMGHVHELLVESPEVTTRLHTDETDIIADRGILPDMDVNGRLFVHPDSRWYGVTGTAMKTRIVGADGYQEMAGYPPTDLGYLELNYDSESPGDDGRGISISPVYYKSLDALSQ